MAEANQVARPAPAGAPGQAVTAGRGNQPNLQQVNANVAHTVASAPTPPPRVRYRGESNDNPYLNMLLYSDYGVGKTHLAGTADNVSEMRDVLMANVDYGDEVIQKTSHIGILDFTTYDEFNQLYFFLNRHCQLRDANDVEGMRKLESEYMRIPLAQIEEPHRYHTVIFDSLTEMQKLCMYKQLGINITTTKVGDSIPKPQFEEWNQILEQLMLFVRKFRNMPIHSIFLCQLDEDFDDKKKRYYLPQLQGQAQKIIHGFFDCVGYYAAAIDGTEIKRRLYVSPIGQFKAKNRFINFNQHFIDNPTMADIINAQKGLYKGPANK